MRESAIQMQISFCKWKPFNAHYYKDKLFFLYDTPYGTLYKVKNQYYLVKSNCMTKIPLYLAQSLVRGEFVTRHYGIYIFYNHVEQVQAIKWLMKMEAYPYLTPMAAKKRERILRDYALWIGYDEDYKRVREERERRLTNG